MNAAQLPNVRGDNSNFVALTLRYPRRRSSLHLSRTHFPLLHSKRVPSRRYWEPWSGVEAGGLLPTAERAVPDPFSLSDSGACRTLPEPPAVRRHQGIEAYSTGRVRRAGSRPCCRQWPRSFRLEPSTRHPHVMRPVMLLGGQGPRKTLMCITVWARLQDENI